MLDAVEELMMIEEAEVGTDEYGADAGDVTGRLIRPYAMTGGRTLVDTDIGLETQIQEPHGRRTIWVPTDGRLPRWSNWCRHRWR